MSKPDDIGQDLIDAMCLTWRHDFGLAEVTEFAGMTEASKVGLRLQMRQIYEHHFVPAILAATAAEREACAAVADSLAKGNPKQVPTGDLQSTRDIVWAGLDAAAITKAKEIAAAIRKRGEG